MGRYFGTDGFRGRANESLTAVQAFRIGRFLGAYYSRGKEGRPRIVVGKDTRLSSYMFEYALTAGATASGADVYLLHVTTTPSVSFVARTDAFDCGVMISASHNPYTDNGIKLLNGTGEKMEESVLAQVEDYLDGGMLPLATGKDIGRTVDYVAGRNRYLAYLLSLPRSSFRGLRIGLDCANGSAWAISKAVFDALGAQAYVTGASPNGENINEGCGSTCITRLQSLVREHSLDLGFAFDGDADRCICVDERGEIVDGDGVLYLCAKRLRDRGELDGGGIVATVMSNHGLLRSLEKENIAVRLTEVGDKYVYEEMVHSGYLLGGEQSGHVIFRKYATTGDGILTALMVTEAVLESKCPLSYLTRGYAKLCQRSGNVRVTDKRSVLADGGVLKAVAAAEELLAGGRVLLRASGTEPVIRVLAEGEDVSACERAVTELTQALRAAERARSES
ncbi:MAG: phosphoglucosamine mutase [Clostridia bacterium]|nr:phosphoglucosamine mutase [Clostridia bacterium]